MRHSGRGSNTTSATFSSLSSELGAVLARHPLPTEHSSIVLHNCHGRGARREQTAAFGNRNAHILAGITVQNVDTDKQLEPHARNWPSDVYSDLAKAGLLTGWKYVNFNQPEEGDGKMYLGTEGVKRMRQIKEKWDPNGLFKRCTPDLSTEA